MNRIQFFKSLLGLAIAPIVIKEVAENPWPEKLANSETVTAEVTPILRDLPYEFQFYTSEGIVYDDSIEMIVARLHRAIQKQSIINCARSQKTWPVI